MVLFGKDALFNLNKSGIEDYLNYLEEIESSIEKQNTIMEEQAKGILDEDFEEYLYHYEDEHYKYHTLFPTILRRSIFTSLYSYFEHMLIELCEDRVKLKATKGTGIEKAKTYLTSHYGLGKLFVGAEWNLIKQYSKVRNCFLHADGVVYLYSKEHEQREIHRFIDKTNGISLNQGDVIALDSVFCREFSDVAIDFLTRTYEEIKSKEKKHPDSF
ncbi:hypothetical protein ACFPYN_11925 [Paenisporosarcina macmurdoensis]|uniref:Cthe-2314-like HEPN domain-containing protein n=1 Tax=Paenisporosarcina macmurdoensis TaxID=212659 RepID=A0ABW1L8Z6_9BACL